jgi:hypothetical protein
LAAATGKKALSLKEFTERLNDVQTVSLEFHSQRGDFEKWVSDVVKDRTLSEQLRQVATKHLKGEELRKQFYSIVTNL